MVRVTRGIVAAGALLLVGGFGSRTVHAQAVGPPSDVSAEDLPAPGSAFAFSLATTAAPVAAGVVLGEEAGLGLIGVGLLFGPLSGYAYGDVMDRGGRGLGFRAAVAGGTVAGILVMCQLGECNPFSDTNEDQDLATGALLLGLVGSAVVGGSALIDVLSVPDHVSRRNAARRAEVSIAPILGPSGDAGLMARIRF